MKGYCLKAPNGDLCPDYCGRTPAIVRDRAEKNIAEPEWRYIAAKGFKIVPVEVKEISPDEMKPINYRKAKAGEIRCDECRDGSMPRTRRQRWRCDGPLGGKTTAKANTCDKARLTLGRKAKGKR